MLEEGTKVVFSNLGKKHNGTISKVNMKFPGIHSGKSTYEIKGEDGNLYKDVLPRYVFKKKCENLSYNPNSAEQTFY